MAVDRFLSHGMTGAQMYQLLRKGMYFYNVEDYGAVHDGVIDPVTGDLTSGTDDTAAIQAAILDAWEAGGGTIFFPAGVYRISGTLVTSYNGQNPNCQIYIPINSNSESAKTLLFLGEMGVPTFTSVITSNQMHTYGTILYSDITGSGSYPSIIGGKNNNATFGVYYINCDIDFENINFRVKANAATTGPTMCGVNGIHFSNMGVKRCRADISVQPQASIEPVNDVFGFRSWWSGGNSRSTWYDTLVTGFKFGYIFGELCSGDGIQAYGCTHAFVADHGAHGSLFQKMTASGCINVFTSARDAGLEIRRPSPVGENKAALRCNMLNWEKGTYGGLWSAPVNVVVDSEDEIYGRVFVSPVDGNVDMTEPLTKVGGANFNTVYLID